MKLSKAIEMAIKRSVGLVKFYQSLLGIPTEGEIRRRLEYLPVRS